MKKSTGKKYCVQCGNELHNILGKKEGYLACMINVCMQPVCPNYGLFQVGEPEPAKEEKSD